MAKEMAPALALVVCAWVSTLVLAAESRSGPSASDWLGAAAYVRAELAAEPPSDKDLIVFAPSWMDPQGRQYLGDLMSIEMAARMDASSYSRIFEISIRGAESAETAGLALQTTTHVGPIRIREFTQEAAIVATDFRDIWKRAVVSGQMQGRPNLSLEEVGFAPRRCIKVVPRPNQEASMRFDSALLGNEIVAYVGLADVFTRRDIRLPGRFEIWVNDVRVAEATATVDNGWQRLRVPTTPGQGSVEFRFKAMGEGARDRRICFAAEARQ